MLKGVFLLFTLLLLGASGASGASIHPPSEGIYHSAHPDFGLQDDEVSVERVRAFTERAGKKIVWAYVSDHWNNGIAFPKDACLVLNREGIIPLVGIMPWSTQIQNKAEPRYTLERILSGEFDSQIKRYAEQAASLPFPLMIEFGPEANGSWFPWNAAWNGRGETKGYGDARHPDGAERFRDTYRHMVSLFREAGADNVTWVFHLAARPWPIQSWNDPKYYYPGDEWVDWIGISLYGRLGGGDLLSFDSIMQTVYPQLLSLSSQKPFAILEIGVSDGNGHDKAAWIRSAYRSLGSGNYPKIKAVAWWNKIYRPDGTRSFLEIDSSQLSLEAYRESVADLLEAVE